MTQNFSGTGPYVEISWVGYTNDDRIEQRSTKLERRPNDQITYTGSPNKSLKYFMDLTDEVNFSESGILAQTADFVHFQESRIGANETFIIGKVSNVSNTYQIITSYEKSTALSVPNQYSGIIRYHLLGRRTIPTDFPRTLPQDFPEKLYKCYFSTSGLPRAERGYQSVSGTMKVNFADRKLSGEFTEGNTPPATSLRVTFSGTIDQNSNVPTGTITSIDGNASGAFVGDFFGPQAKQLGAIFTLNVVGRDTVGYMTCLRSL